MSVFRKYDIRGIYGTDISEKIFEQMGNALGQTLSRDIVVARDARTSSASLQSALIRGVTQTDANVMNIGEVPLPYAMYWAYSNMQELAYVTASHLPAEWNGLKLFHYNGLGYTEDEMHRIRQLVEEQRIVKSVASVTIGVGIEDVVAPYHNHVLQKIKAARPLRIVIDCGNGTAGIAKQLFEKAGFTVEMLFDKPDGRFPNRSPDPKEDALEELRKRVHDADMGIAYDGDADRMFLVDARGRKLAPEQASAIMLEDIMKEAQGQIVANAECSSLIDDIAKRHGREVIRVPVGHTFLIEAVHRNNACYGVETAGHYVISSLSSFDDAIAASLYAAAALSRRDEKLHELVDALPRKRAERLRFECDDAKKFAVVDLLRKRIAAEHEISELDGVRVSAPDGWALIRASNTEPAIRLTVEGGDDQAFSRIREKFSGLVQSAISSQE